MSGSVGLLESGPAILLDRREAMRIKITNKKPIAFENTVGGLKELIKKLEKENIPDDAQVYFRNPRIAEFMWSSLDDN
jgi:hypothetical protein